MSEMLNTVITGNYKNCVIVLKEQENKPVLTCKGFLSKKEIPMDKSMIRKMNHTLIEDQTHDVIIEWKDGTLSQVIMDQNTYIAVQAEMS